MTEEDTFNALRKKDFQDLYPEYLKWLNDCSIERVKKIADREIWLRYHGWSHTELLNAVARRLRQDDKFIHKCHNAD